MVNVSADARNEIILYISEDIKQRYCKRKGREIQGFYWMANIPCPPNEEQPISNLKKNQSGIRFIDDLALGMNQSSIRKEYILF